MKSSKFAKFPLKTVVTLAIILAFGGWYYGRHSHKKIEGDPQAGVIKRVNLAQRVTVSGQIWPRKRQDIKPPYVGFIAKMFVKVGDHVKKGDPLVTFSPSLSGTDSNFPLRAGFDGVVTQVMKTEGEYLADATDQNLVARLEDLTELSVLGSVPELDVAKVKIGEDAMIRVSALPGETFKGKIHEIALSARDKERWSSASTEFQVKATVTTRDPRLMTGMSALMDVITAKRQGVMALTHEYIQEDQEGDFVTLAGGEIRRVHLGLQTDEAAEILDGVKVGERAMPINFLSLPKQAEDAP